jgi:hypothetical protein
VLAPALPFLVIWGVKERNRRILKVHEGSYGTAHSLTPQLGMVLM